MMRALLLAVGLSLACAAAHADEITFSSAVPPTGYDAYGGFGFNVLTPGFDSTLGTLESVTMTVVGSVQDSIFSASGDTLPFAAVFNNVGGISGYGFNEEGVLSQNTGTATTLFADNSFGVNASVTTNQDLKDYAAHSVIDTSYIFYSTVTNAGTGQIVSYDSDNAVFSGTITETFYYSTDVPEPASLAVFAFGLLALATLATWRRA
jgi:hypothetical protein